MDRNEACEFTNHMSNEQGHNAELMIHPPSKNLKGLAAVLKKALPDSQPKELFTKLEKVKNIDKYVHRFSPY